MAALNAGDWEASIESISSDVEWVVAKEHPNARTIHGLDDARAYREDWSQTLPGFKIELGEITERGDAVLALGSVRGAGAGSGAEVTVPLALVYRFEGDVIVRVEEYLDLDEARRAV
jgi:ketosteroid isomerase-like protein